MWNKLAYLMLFIFAIGLFWAGQARAADPSLQLWLEFEGNANDSSVNGRNGTLNGAPLYVPGIFGQGLDLNGNPDYVAITGYKGVLGTNPFTVATWVRTTDTGSSVIASWGDDVGTAGNGRRVEFRLDAGRLRVEHGNGSLLGNTVMNDNEWHHVALTAKANATLVKTDTRLYLDGVDDTSGTSDPDPFNTFAKWDLTLGRRSHIGTGTVRWLNAEFDDFRMYDR